MVKPITEKQRFCLDQTESTVCRQQFKCCSNDELFLDWIENIMGKGENAGNFFSQYFQRLPLFSVNR